MGLTRVIAHRGASAAERENTVAAFARAVAMGADGIELDVRRTADGQPAIHHDPDLPDGRPIASLLAADLPMVPLYHRTLAWAMRPNVSLVQWPNDVLDLRWVQVD